MAYIAHRIFLNTLIYKIIDSVYKALLCHSIQIWDKSLCFNRIYRVNINERFLPISKIYPTLWRGCGPNSTL